MKISFFHFAYPLGIYNTTKLDWKRSSGRLEFWKGLLLATDVSTTERKPSSESSTFWLWRWLPRRLSKRQCQPSVPLRTQMIFFNKGMLLLSSNHFPIIRQANEFSLQLLFWTKRNPSWAFLNCYIVLTYEAPTVLSLDEGLQRYDSSEILISLHSI